MEQLWDPPWSPERMSEEAKRTITVDASRIWTVAEPRICPHVLRRESPRCRGIRTRTSQNRTAGQPHLTGRGRSQDLKHLKGPPARRARARGDRADVVHPAILSRARLEVWRGAEIVRPRVDILAAIGALNDLLRAVAKPLQVT